MSDLFNEPFDRRGRVPVLWLSHHSEVDGRRQWDAGLLRRVFDRTLWSPVPGHKYVQVGAGTISSTFTEVAAPGAVVVVPAQHHAASDDVAQINEELGRLEWCVVILIGDEHSVFPWRELRHPRMRLWVMTPRPDVHADLAYRCAEYLPNRFLGEGWHYDTPDVLAEPIDFAGLLMPPARVKTDRFFFAGQVTHRRRDDCVAGLLAFDPTTEHVIQTPGFTQGLDRHKYLRHLAAAATAPAPSGPGTPDSFRAYEALEAGTLPLVDATTPEGWTGYWPFLLGEDPPFPVVEDWSTIGTVIETAQRDWPANINRASAWWQQRKRDLAWSIDADVTALSGQRPQPEGPQDQITVLIPTSPTPSNPFTDLIEATVGSIRAQPDLADAEIIVMVDGVRAEQEDRRSVYEEYTRRLLLLTEQWHNVVPLVAEEHLHQANLTRLGLSMVRTPAILFVEHDTPLVHPSEGTIPWGELTKVMLGRSIGAIRFHHESEVLAVHRHLMLDRTPRVVDGVPLLRCAQWSQRPHLAQTQFYRWLIDTYFGRDSRTMIEDVVHGVIDQAWREHGQEGWARFGLCMYAPPGNIRRSYHLDGRGDDPKFEMTFSYDGPTPEGAPAPTAGRVD